jgi:hypothetical protein
MILVQLSHKLSLASSSGHPTAINPVWEAAEKPHERSYLLSGLFCFGDAGLEGRLLAPRGSRKSHILALAPWSGHLANSLATMPTSGGQPEGALSLIRAKGAKSVESRILDCHPTIGTLAGR